MVENINTLAEISRTTVANIIPIESATTVMEMGVEDDRRTHSNTQVDLYHITLIV